MAEKQKHKLSVAPFQEWMQRGQIGKIDAALSATVREGVPPQKTLLAIGTLAIAGGFNDALAACLEHKIFRAQELLRDLMAEACLRDAQEAVFILMDAGHNPNKQFLLLDGRKLHAWQTVGTIQAAGAHEWTERFPRKWRHGAALPELCSPEQAARATSLIEHAVDLASESDGFRFAKEIARRGGEMTPAVWSRVGARSQELELLDGLDWMIEARADLAAEYPLDALFEGKAYAKSGHALEMWLRAFRSSGYAAAGMQNGEWKRLTAGVARLIEAGGPGLWTALCPDALNQPIHAVWRQGSRASGWAERQNPKTAEVEAEAIFAWILSQEGDSSAMDAHGRHVVHHAMSADDPAAAGASYFDELTPLARLALKSCPFEWLQQQRERVKGSLVEGKFQAIYAAREQEELAAALAAVAAMDNASRAAQSSLDLNAQPNDPEAAKPFARRGGFRL